MKELLRNPILRFLVLGTGIYLLWYFLYAYWVKPDLPVDERIIDNLIAINEWVLSAVGYTMIEYSDSLFDVHKTGIAGSTGVLIGPECDGMVLFGLFIAFIVAFPGPWKHKLWFIPMGLISIHLINSLRVIALVLIQYYRPQWLAINHDYTFTIIVYAFVFLLWYLWVNKFSPLKS
ncbi:exosortase X [Halocola ammonii]